MIVIVIMSVAIGIAAPSYSEFIEQNKLTTSTNKFINAMNSARNEAISRRENVRLAPSDNGWSVTAVPITTMTTTTLLTYDLDEGINLSVSDDSIASVTFSPDGYRDLTGNTSSFDITLCKTDSLNNRTISINSVGVARVTKGTSGCP